MQLPPSDSHDCIYNLQLLEIVCKDCGLGILCFESEGCEGNAGPPLTLLRRMGCSIQREQRVSRQGGLGAIFPPVIVLPVELRNVY